MTRLPSPSNFMPFDMPLGERKILACLVLGSYLQMLPAWAYLPEGSLQMLVKVMSLKYTMPSGLVATPSVSAHASPNTRSSFAPEGSTLASPVGVGNPGSSALAPPAISNNPSIVPTAQTWRSLPPNAGVKHLDVALLQRIIMVYPPVCVSRSHAPWLTGRTVA